MSTSAPTTATFSQAAEPGMAPRLVAGGAAGAAAGWLLGRALALVRRGGDRAALAAASGNKDWDRIVKPEGFTPPEPRKFTIPKGQLTRVLAAALPSLFRFGNGVFVEGWRPRLAKDDDGASYSFVRGSGWRLVEESRTLPTIRPDLPLKLWEYQGSPYCRKVREACCVLDLVVEFRPCPQGGPTFRPEAKGKGWPTFPHLVDPNTGADMGESDDIVAYLFQTYGGGRKVPFLLSSNPLNTFALYVAALVRYGPGSVYKPARRPKEPLHLWAYEPAPFSVIAREVLSELELPHVLHYCPRGSVHRDELQARAGLCQLPYLEDPNTGVKMFESTAIAQYLYDVYALP